MGPKLKKEEQEEEDEEKEGQGEEAGSVALQSFPQGVTNEIIIYSNY